MGGWMSGPCEVVTAVLTSSGDLGGLEGGTLVVEGVGNVEEVVQRTTKSLLIVVMMVEVDGGGRWRAQGSGGVQWLMARAFRWHWSLGEGTWRCK